MSATEQQDVRISDLPLAGYTVAVTAARRREELGARRESVVEVARHRRYGVGPAAREVDHEHGRHGAEAETR